MKKRIYLIQHSYVDTWKYIGATTHKNINDSLTKKWNEKTRDCKNKNLVLKALRCSERSDWSIEQLHDFTEDWKRLEAEYIAKYDSFHNGLNSTASGAAENTPRQKTAMIQACSKSVLCSNGITYPSVHEASRQTGVSQPHISHCCTGKRKTAGGFTWRFA